MLLSVTEPLGSNGREDPQGNGWVHTVAVYTVLMAESTKWPEVSPGEVQSPVCGCLGIAAVLVISRPLSVSSGFQVLQGCEGAHTLAFKTPATWMGPHLWDKAALGQCWAREPCLYF